MVVLKGFWPEVCECQVPWTMTLTQIGTAKCYSQWSIKNTGISKSYMGSVFWVLISLYQAIFERERQRKDIRNESGKTIHTIFHPATAVSTADLYPTITQAQGRTPCSEKTQLDHPKDGGVKLFWFNSSWHKISLQVMK